MVTLADGDADRGALAIAAEGRESRLRAEMGIDVIGWSYPADRHRRDGGA